MSAGQLALVVATVLCALGFAALCVVLIRVLDTLGSLRAEVAELRAETRPLLAELRTSVDAARDDLERFDKVLGSAEAISTSVARNMEGAGLVARSALSAPIIKTVAFASGTGRAARRLRNGARSEVGNERARGRDTVLPALEQSTPTRRGRRAR
jgi:uncharacterized protein YoxC